VSESNDMTDWLDEAERAAKVVIERLYGEGRAALAADVGAVARAAPSGQPGRPVPEVPTGSRAVAVRPQPRSATPAAPAVASGSPAPAPPRAGAVRAGRVESAGDSADSAERSDAR
jgi:hypothetical protein